MNVSHLTLAAVVAAVFLSLPSGFARAADEGTPPPAEGASQSGGKKKSGSNASVPFRGTVGSVDSSAMTVTLAGKKKDRVLHVSGQTRLERDGKSAAIGDIRPGDFARGSITQEADGREVLVKASFGEAPAAAGRPGSAAPETARTER